MIEFNNKNKQVELNQERLKEESERYYEIKSRIGILTIFYSIFAYYTVQLVTFAISSNEAGFFYISILIVFLILFGTSMLYTIRLLMPKDVAFKETPEVFYKKVYKEYEENPRVLNEHINFYVRETYLEQLEKAVELNFRLNNRKSKFNYYAFILAISAILPYLICIGIKITKDPDNIQKIELVNSQIELKNDTIYSLKIREIIMTDQDTSNQQENISNEEPTIDPNEVIHRDPEMIKENKEFPETKNEPLHDDNGKQ